MKTRRHLTRFSAISAIALVIVSCSTLRPKATKHYKKALFDPPISNPAPHEDSLVEISAFVLDAGSGSSKTVFDLSDRAQAEYVEGMADRIGDKGKPKDLAAAVALPIRKSQAPTVIDRSKFKKRFVISVDNAPMLPATRLERSTATIELSDRGMFKSWSRLATEYATVDLGDLTFTQQNKFTLGAELGAPQIKELTSVSAGSEFTRGLTEAIELSRRYRVVSGALTPKRAQLTRQAVRGIDLTGNTVVDITVAVEHHETTQHRFSNLRNATGTPNPGAQVKLVMAQVRFAKHACPDVTATVRLDYVLRAVGKGESTYMESDDEVTFQRRFTGVGSWSSSKNTFTYDPVSIVTVRDMKFWSLILADWQTGDPVNIETVRGPETIFFGSLSEADQFLEWLLARKGDSIQGRNLFLDTNPINPASDLSRLRADRVEHNSAACSG